MHRKKKKEQCIMGECYDASCLSNRSSFSMVRGEGEHV